LPAAAEDGAQGKIVLPQQGIALTGEDRREACYLIRNAGAKAGRRAAIPEHEDNGDEARYGNRIGNYSKGLPHNSLGAVDSAAYDSLLTALDSGRHADFESIVMGASAPVFQRKLVNPQAGLAYDMEGVDSHGCPQPPAPAVASAEAAGELVENYWMALTRDVPFAEYDTHPLTQSAASDISGLSDFRGPKAAGRVTTGTLFRGFTPGDLVGPYISQFLWMPVPFGAVTYDQKMQTTLPGLDFMTSFSDWLAIQNGNTPVGASPYDVTRRYIRNGRDLSQWVHIDVLFQAYFQAAVILMGLGAPLNPGNPYAASRTQDGFGTFGPPHIATLVAEVSTRALKAVWFQKWYVHRRLRPEAMAGLVHNAKFGVAHPLHADVLTRSAVLDQIRGRYGTYLLPQAFAEGSPLHPSYGAGHATVAGACVTVLKAMFDERFVLPNPVVATPDGLSLAAYTGPDAGSLTVGGELNKLAANVGVGRNIAGVHYRSDYAESLKLGEAVAISLLRESGDTYNEPLTGLTFTKFDGTRVRV